MMTAMTGDMPSVIATIKWWYKSLHSILMMPGELERENICYLIFIVYAA